MKKDIDYTKRKVSVDIKAENIQAIEAFKAEGSLDGLYSLKTTTDIINDCISLLLNTSKEYRDTLSKIAYSKIREFNPNSIREQALEEDIDKWRELYTFLTHNRGLYEKPKEFVRHDFSDGYIIVPSDWIFLDPNAVNNEFYKYPTIIEFRNGGLYNLPHFFFIGQSPSLTSGMEDEYIRMACEKYPPLNDIMPLVVEPIMSNGKMLNEDIFMNAPQPGFFKFPQYGNKYSKSFFGELWVTEDKIELMKKYGEKK